jgi:hypothetical protein
MSKIILVSGLNLLKKTGVSNILLVYGISFIAQASQTQVPSLRFSDGYCTLFLWLFGKLTGKFGQIGGNGTNLLYRYYYTCFF